MQNLAEIAISKYLTLSRRIAQAQGSAASLRDYTKLIFSRTHANHPLLAKVSWTPYISTAGNRINRGGHPPTSACNYNLRLQLQPYMPETSALMASARAI